MFSLTKYKDDGTKESIEFEVLELALREAETCKETKFELESDNVFLHMTGEKRDNDHIDWQTVPD